jgi:hypothetical protein
MLVSSVEGSEGEEKITFICPKCKKTEEKSIKELQK